MQESVRERLAVLALSLAVLAAVPAAAAPVLGAKQLACGGSGAQSGSIAVSRSRGVLTLRLRGSNLVPGQPVRCGYTCGQVFTTGPDVPCGTVAANGRLSARIDLPVNVCFGFIPFFSTPTTGKCVGSTVP
jgi:hypothetical protein